MEQQKIDMFISVNAEKFDASQIYTIKDQLATMDDSRFLMVQSAGYKDPTTMLIISIFLGSLGIDRFMLGQSGLGVLKLITCGACGIWTIIDWFTISKLTKDFNFNKFMQMM